MAAKVGVVEPAGAGSVRLTALGRRLIPGADASFVGLASHANRS